MPRIGIQKLGFGFLSIVLLFMVTVAPVAAQGEMHVVQPGETLFRIALRYGVDVNTLAQANNIVNTGQINAGQTLVIPSGILQPPPAVPAAPPVDAGAPVYHTVQRGENLAAIARSYGLTPEQLAQLNNLINPNLIYAGQELIVSGTPSQPTGETQPIENVPIAEPVQPAPSPSTYVVQRGDRLGTIAEQFGISWLDLAQANNIFNADHIEVGQQLIIPAVGTSNTPVSVTDMGILTGPAAPAAYNPVGRTVLVDLSDSRVYAYEDGVLVRNVLVSTGLPATPTVQGDFHIYVKYEAQLMAGPGYYLPDVPYVMYFYEGYGLHGTYWHENWGVPMSHGCVNMPTPEAEWFYNWTSVGTPVRVQY